MRSSGSGWAGDAVVQEETLRLRASVSPKVLQGVHGSQSLARGSGLSNPSQFQLKPLPQRGGWVVLGTLRQHGQER